MTEHSKKDRSVSQCKRHKCPYGFKQENSMKEYQEQEKHLRKFLGKTQAELKIRYPCNKDVCKIPQFRGSFSKALPHDDQGNVNSEEFKKFAVSFWDNNPDLLLKVKLGTSNGMKLVSASAVFDIELIGAYKDSLRIPVAPKMLSEQSAGEMVELYAMSLLRDLPYSDWNESNLTVKLALDALNSLPVFYGPKENGKVTVQTLFRGNGIGNLNGPFVSQLLLRNFKNGVYETIPKTNYPLPYPENTFMITLDKAISVQNGLVTGFNTYKPEKTYIHTLRDGARYVHVDEPCQPYYDAVMILFGLKVPLFKGNPYVNGKITNQTAFTDLGKCDLIDLLGRAMKLAFDASWFDKYFNLKLRPEAYGIQVQLKKNGDNTLSIPDSLLNSAVLSASHDQVGSYLLPQAYPEGSPAHPAYPSGHATTGGAMITILKAWFNGETEFPGGVYQASGDGLSLDALLGVKLTVEGELNKLASNISNYRNAAGIHYRSDADEGLHLGEKVAIYLLKEHILRYNVPVEFRFRKFDGEEVIINNFDKECPKN